MIELNEQLREFGLHAHTACIPRGPGVVVGDAVVYDCATVVFVVSLDAHDPTRPDRAEVAMRVRAWQKERGL